MTVIAPVVNINGTSKAELLQQHRAAHHAVTTAINLLVPAAPHPRDFQTDPDGDAHYKYLRERHVERLRSLERIRSELEELWLAIDAQPAPFGERV